MQDISRPLLWIIRAKERRNANNNTCNPKLSYFKCMKHIMYLIRFLHLLQDSNMERVILVSPKFGISQITGLRNSVVSLNTLWISIFLTENSYILPLRYKILCLYLNVKFWKELVLSFSCDETTKKYKLIFPVWWSVSVHISTGSDSSNAKFRKYVKFLYHCHVCNYCCVNCISYNICTLVYNQLHMKFHLPCSIVSFMSGLMLDLT